MAAFDGPITEALEQATRLVLETMPREFDGRDLGVAAISLDQDRGIVRFVWRDGASAVATAQVIGVYLEPETAGANPTWQWAWSQSLFQPNMMLHADILRRYGDRNRVPELGALEVEAPKELFWSFAMLAAALNDARGVVGVPVNGAMILVTIGAVRAA